MNSTFISHFTPSLMAPEALEAILVQRHQLADDLAAAIRESALTAKKNFHLLLGMRGIGKTHMVALTYHRISKMEDLRDKLLIAWLREEEWGVTTFLDLLLRIFRALQQEYPAEYEAKLNQQVEALYQLSANEAEPIAADLLREFVGKHTLLLLMENLDDLFDGLGKNGQKQLREYIDNYSFLTILATAQSGFAGINVKNSPFYDFFQIHPLEELTLEEAIDLLRQIARLEGKNDLESFILTSTGRDRIRAVHHLAAGNPRVYVIFSQFLTRKSLDELVEPFMRMLDDLTPYYQARMAWLSQQQRKIIEFLTNHRRAVTVKEIAQRCFITHQTASSQLKDLREKGYVNAETVGRESFYELREPLMRFCMEVKKQRGEAIRLFVDFLRIWYTKEELKQRLEILPPDAEIERDYILHALQIIEEEPEDPRIAEYLKDVFASFENKDYLHCLKIADKLIAIRGYANDWFIHGCILHEFKHYEQALLSIDKAIDIDPNQKLSWLLRGLTLDETEDYEEALTSYNKVIELDQNYVDAWYRRGRILKNIKQYDEALKSYNKVTKLNDNHEGAWLLRGEILLYNLEHYDEALESFYKAMEINQDEKDIYWNYISACLSGIGQYEAALEFCDKLIELEPNEAIYWANRGAMLTNLERYDQALESYNKAVDINPFDAKAWYDRGNILLNLECDEEALVSFNKAIKLDSTDVNTWLKRSLILYDLERYDESLESSKQTIALGYQSSEILFNVADCLLAMNRWEEGIKALDDVLNKLSNEEEPNLEDTEYIIRNIFTNYKDVSVWKSRITTLIEIYDKYQLISALGKAIIDNIPAVMSEMVSDKAAQTWLEVWRELVGNRPEFQIPLRLLNAAVRYRETKGDKRVLLELPIEERKILQQVLEIEES
ncbi:tetratricopeptide repeat protein,HTH domain-containing protein [Cylindrospermum stagnale PCC 7417]|uniref:Tetratricopeptide repeat protein,HTH domain-containing protein n=1 Tax=Cylindrospermum stagnale PCC 7417 TaxID=56107 RepID=K9X345_9NOST|nr:winged helix-turn-helix domain-containing protein [Cylindrospermum stagnale]AFZ26102.1 tetratricopeptide repeat protein,HTH domain-containing protein [Cylindrospermum stagnale PCC 7417]